MRKLIFVWVLLLCIPMSLKAQTDDDQLLFFRNTGEVNLFYTSRIDSIVCSHMAADQTMHDTIVSQIVYTADTMVVVPICEIDSVAVGSRNAIVTKENVRMMRNVDSLWIAGYDGTHLYYKSNTPEDMLPKVDEKLFYGKADNLFPFGLAARVDALTKRTDDYMVTLTHVELSDIFERLFYAGTLEPLPDVATRNAAKSVLHAPLSPERPSWELQRTQTLQFNIPLADYANLYGTDELGIGGQIVVDPLHGFYHFKGVISNDIDAGADVHIDDLEPLETHKDLLTIPLGTYALVFTPMIVVSAFAELNAEMNGGIKVMRSGSIPFEYIRRPNADPVFTLGTPTATDGGATMLSHLTLNGDLMIGIRAALDCNVLLQMAGARLSVGVGPSFEGEFGFGALTKLRNFDQDFYGKACLNTCLKIRAKGSIYHRSLSDNNEDETEFFGMDFKLLQRQLDLFPRYTQTTAVAVPATVSPEVTMSTRSSNEVLGDLETGFELVTTDNHVVDSVYVGTVKAGTESVQGQSGAITIDRTAVDDVSHLLARPIFHYAGYTIAAPSVALRSDTQIQPMVFAGSNGAVTFLSGVPFTGQAVKDSTLYMAGPYLPVAVTDTLFHQPTPPHIGIYIDDYRSALLLGTWSGTEAGHEVSYTFNEDRTGTYVCDNAEHSFTYQQNVPQAGRLIIAVADNTRKVLTIVHVSETVMQYRLPNDSKLYTLNKQS